MKNILRKIRAIVDIITSNKFYLVTFTDENEVNWRTEFGIYYDDIIDKI